MGGGEAMGHIVTTSGRLIFAAAIVLASFTASSFAALPAAEGRTLQELSGVVPLRVLQRSISPRFFQSLLISPIDGWIVVRARRSQSRLFGARVIRSSLNGAYDPLALEWAEDVRIAGNNSIGNNDPTENVLVHLLIYQIADGTMVLSFPTVDAPGGSQMKYFGSARLAVRKRDGRWTEIEGPPGLQAKGWAVRESGARNDLSRDRIPQHFELLGSGFK